MIPVTFYGKVFLWTVAEYPMHKLEKEISKVLDFYQIYANHVPCSSTDTLRVPRDTAVITIKVPRWMEGIALKKITDFLMRQPLQRLSHQII